MKFEISRMELQPDGYGNQEIVIKQVKVMDDNGKYLKFAKLNQALIEYLKDAGQISIKK